MKRCLILILLLLTFLCILPLGKAYVYNLEFEWDKARFGKADLTNEHPSSSSARSAYGFNFTTGANAYTLGCVQYWLSKIGSPTANLTAVLYAESSGVPTGNPLAYSDNLVNSSTLTTHTTYAFVTFNFTEANYELSATTAYCLTLEVNTTNVDGSNYVSWGIASITTGLYNRFTYASSAWGVISASYDWIFRVYSLVPDGEAPEITYGGFNSTLNGSVSEFTFNFTDNIALSHYVFGWNNSGSWVNSTTAISGTANQTTFTNTLNSTEGIKVEYQVWVNDTSDNWATMPLMFFITNTEPIIIVTVNIPTLFVGASLLLGAFSFLVFWAKRKK